MRRKSNKAEPKGGAEDDQPGAIAAYVESDLIRVDITALMVM